MPHDANCPLCRGVTNPDQSWGERLIWRFPHSFAILGPWQYYTGYCMLITREHATELSQLEANRAAFLEEMSLLAKGIEVCFQPHKLNYELLGNLVPHLHWHLFPRSSDDPEKLRPVWFATDRAEHDPAERARLQTGKLPPAEVTARLREWLAANNAPTAWV